MTSNQHRAIQIARGLISGGISDTRLSDGEWHLLLLGAGVNCQHAPLLKVAGQVLENADRHRGYFAPAAGESGESMSDLHGRGEHVYAVH